MSIKLDSFMSYQSDTFEHLFSNLSLILFQVEENKMLVFYLFITFLCKNVSFYPKITSCKCMNHDRYESS